MSALFATTYIDRIIYVTMINDVTVTMILVGDIGLLHESRRTGGYTADTASGNWGRWRDKFRTEKPYAAGVEHRGG